jgi:hypothetical protein
MTAADKLADISTILTQQPQLSGAESAEYNRINQRLQRAEADLRRATKRGDAQKLAAAERAITRAKQFRDAFVSPRVGHLWAPARIISKSEGRWSGPGVSGTHYQECEMVLDHKDLSGPSYRTVRVSATRAVRPRTRALRSLRWASRGSRWRIRSGAGRSSWSARRSRRDLSTQTCRPLRGRLRDPLCPLPGLRRHADPPDRGR